ncbi:unnamed protein product, partial [Trichogramma brassicae]
MDYLVNTALVSAASCIWSSTAGAVSVRNGKKEVLRKRVKGHRYVSGKRTDDARCSSDEESDEDEFLDKLHPVEKDQDMLDLEMDKVHTNDNTGDPRLRRLTRIERSMEHLEVERVKRRKHIAEPEVYSQEEVMETSEEMIEMESSDTSDDEDLSKDEIKSVPKLTEITQHENGNGSIEQPCAEQDERKKGTLEKSLQNDQDFKKPQKRAVRGIKYRQLRFKLRWPAEIERRMFATTLSYQGVTNSEEEKNDFFVDSCSAAARSPLSPPWERLQESAELLPLPNTSGWSGAGAPRCHALCFVYIRVSLWRKTFARLCKVSRVFSRSQFYSLLLLLQQLHAHKARVDILIQGGISRCTRCSLHRADGQSRIVSTTNYTTNLPYGDVSLISDVIKPPNRNFLSHRVLLCIRRVWCSAQLLHEGLCAAFCSMLWKAACSSSSRAAYNDDGNICAQDTTIACITHKRRRRPPATTAAVIYTRYIRNIYYTIQYTLCSIGRGKGVIHIGFAALPRLLRQRRSRSKQQSKTTKTTKSYQSPQRNEEQQRQRNGGGNNTARRYPRNYPQQHVVRRYREVAVAASSRSCCLTAREDGQQIVMQLRAPDQERLPLRGLAVAGERPGPLERRLWAEVFHVTSGAGSVKWQQVSEDLVPVNITCIQDTPETIFHITAYNCQVDKILDVRLVQPGTRIGQASECFVYWKDTMTNDTWGLNFTCPIDAKQFRECVSPSFKIPRKASSSYSLRLEPLNSKQSSTKQKVRRKPLSTPASPSRGASREPQCTCMTPEQFNRLRQDPRYRPTCAAQTLPRLTSRSADAEMQQRGDKMPNAVSSGSLYDNVNNSNSTGVGPGGQMTANSAAAAAAQGKLLKPGEQQQQQHTLRRQTSVDKQQQSEQMCQTGVKTANVGIGTTNVGSQVRRAWFMQDQVEGPDGENKVSAATPGGGPHPKKPLLKHQDSMTRQTSFDMGTQSSLGGGLMPGGRYQHRKEQLQHTRSADYTEMELRNGNLFASLDNNNVPPGTRRNKSKSTDDMRIENAHLQARPPSGLVPPQGGGPLGPMGQAQQQQHPLLAGAAGPGGVGGIGPGLGVGGVGVGVGPLPPGAGMLGAAGHMLPPGMVVPPPPPPHVVDHHTLKRMFKPMSSIESPVTSPEMTRKRHPHHINFHQCYPSNNNQQHRYVMSDAENDNYAVYRQPYHNRLQTLRRVHEMNRHYSGDVSPPSDNVIFDNQCYATTPSSSNGNSDLEQQPGGGQPGPGGMPHCQQRNCNGQGPVYGPPPPQRPPSVQAQRPPSVQAQQRPASVQAQRPPSVQRQNSRDQQPQQQQAQQQGQGQGQQQQQQGQNASTPGSPTSRLLLEYEMHLRNTLAKGSSANKSSTLPQSYRYCTERQNSRDRDGYYSDRNEIMRERRERDYDRDRGYQSDYNSQSRCASCIGESARAQWFRHSDGWRSGSSTFGSTASSVPTYTGFHRGGPWDSLPSLRHEGSLNDSGYKSNRTDSLEHRGTFDRQDSVRSDYMSDRESRYGIVQQASLESTDSRLCYLTSSE